MRRLGKRADDVLGSRAGAIKSLSFFVVLFLPLLLYFIFHPFGGGDYYHQAWVFHNNLNNIQHLQSLREANIYYPVKGAGVLHELQLLNTLLYWPFDAAGWYLQGYFFVLYVATVLTGFSVYWLAVLLGARPAIALTFAVIACFFGFRSYHLMHVQALSLGWLILPIAFLLCYYRTRRFLFIALYTLFFALNLAGPSYLGIAMLFVLISIGIAFLPRLRTEFSFISRFVAASAVGGLVASPMLFMVLSEASRGLKRNVGEMTALASDVFQVLTPQAGTLLYGELPALLKFEHYVSSWIFPGYTVLLAMTAAFLVLVRKRERIDPATRDARPFLIGILAASWLMLAFSLGPWIKILGDALVPNPFVVLFYDYIPVLAATRFLPTFGYVAFTLLVACTAAILSRTPAVTARADKLRPWARYGLLAAFAVVAILENVNYQAVAGQIEFAKKVDLVGLPAAYRFVATLPRGVVLSLPTGHPDEYTYMYYSLHHPHKTFNGITGFIPLLQTIGHKVLVTFPDRQSVDFVRSIGVDYVVVHRARMAKDGEGCRAFVASADATVAFEDASACVLVLNPSNGPSIDTYRPGPPITFGHDGNFWRYVPGLLDKPIQDTGGWSPGSADAMWTTGPVASLAMRLDGDDLDAGATLTLVTRGAFAARVNPEFFVELWANGFLVETWRFPRDEPAVRTARIPADLLRRPGRTLVLELKVHDPVTPASIGASDDRPLGILVERITLGR
jgi:hypothetical protein